MSPREATNDPSEADGDVGSFGEGTHKRRKSYSTLPRLLPGLETAHPHIKPPFMDWRGQEDDRAEGQSPNNSVKDQDQERRLKPYFIFCRPTKTVYLVRHGNTWLKKYVKPSPFAQERCLFDLPLTSLGVNQATALGEKLGSLKADVIICSPLTRALETLKYALPPLQPIRCEISAIHTESLQVSGDVGRSPEHLAKEFPWAFFGGLDPVWWYSPSEAPNDSQKCLFQSREPTESVRIRIGLFRRFLCARPESVIVVIGHSTFFMGVLGTNKRLGNCEWAKMRL